MKGYIQVHTGSGKGKTTAALGLALRAAGAGLRVFFAQFAKSGRTSEIIALERFADLITVRQYGCGRFIRGEPTKTDVEAARRGLAECDAALRSGEYQVVILDEANVAADFRLVTVEDLLALCDARPASVELVFTGRNAPAALIDRADLVTEMRAVKHYFSKGVRARKGIEE